VTQQERGKPFDSVSGANQEPKLPTKQASKAIGKEKTFKRKSCDIISKGTSHQKHQH